MRHRALAALKSLLTIILTAALLGLQVKPDDVLSNASAWMIRLGFSDLPWWLTRASAERYLSLVIGGLLFATIAWIFWPSVVRPGRGPPPSVALFHFPAGAYEGETGSVQRQGLPDTPIHKAIDYIVSNSLAPLRQAPKGYDERVTSLFKWRGEEHQHAIEQVRERAVLGELRVWGCMQIGEPSAMSFDNVLREIPADYWQTATFDVPFCFHKTEHSQTARLSRDGDIPLFTHITLSNMQAAELLAKKTFVASATRLGDAEGTPKLLATIPCSLRAPTALRPCLQPVLSEGDSLSGQSRPQRSVGYCVRFPSIVALRTA